MKNLMKELSTYFLVEEIVDLELQLALKKEELVSLYEEEEEEGVDLEAEIDQLERDFCIATQYVVGHDMVVAIATLPFELIPSVGVAKCSPDDEFDEVTGKYIALKRALGLGGEINPEEFGKPKVVDYTEVEGYGYCGECKDKELEMSETPCKRCKHVWLGDQDNWRPKK